MIAQYFNYQLACLTPVFVCQERWCLLAKRADVIVEPLLPPHPTSIKPIFGTLISVLISSFVDSRSTFNKIFSTLYIFFYVKILSRLFFNELLITFCSHTHIVLWSRIIVSFGNFLSLIFVLCDYVLFGVLNFWWIDFEFQVHFQNCWSQVTVLQEYWKWEVFLSGNIWDANVTI